MTVTNVVCYGGNNGSACVDIVGIEDFTVTLLNTTTGTFALFEAFGGVDVTKVEVLPPAPNGTITISNDFRSFSSTNQGKFCFYGLSAGEYILEGTDNTGNGCYVSAPFTVQEPTPLELDYTSSFHGCNGTVLVDIVATSIGGTPDYVYSVTVDQSTYNASSGNFNNIVVPNGVTTIDVAVTDSKMCTSTLTLDVPNTVTGDIQVLIGTTSTTCYNDCDGSLTVNITGGKAPYSVAITSSISTNTSYNYSTLHCLGEDSCSASKTITDLCAGSYSVAVVDSYGCTYSTVANVNEPLNINYNDITITAPTCATNGCIQVEGITGAVNSNGVVRDLYVTLCEVPEGQAIPVRKRVYIVNNVLTNGTIEFCGLKHGNYKICINDEFGCGITADVGLNPPPVFTIS